VSNEGKTQIEVGGKAVGAWLSPADAMVVLDWLSSEGVQEAFAALYGAGRTNGGAQP
jgi:hypothetical protein